MNIPEELWNEIIHSLLDLNKELDPVADKAYQIMKNKQDFYLEDSTDKKWHFILSHINPIMQYDINKLLNNLFNNHICDFQLYLFGSSINGLCYRKSDLDFAFYETNLETLEHKHLYNKIASIIRQSTEREFDYIDINSHNEHTKFRQSILKEGLLIWPLNPKQC